MAQHVSVGGAAIGVSAERVDSRVARQDGGIVKCEAERAPVRGRKRGESEREKGLLFLAYSCCRTISEERRAIIIGAKQRTEMFDITPRSFPISRTNFA